MMNNEVWKNIKSFLLYTNDQYELIKIQRYKTIMNTLFQPYITKIGKIQHSQEQFHYSLDKDTFRTLYEMDYMKRKEYIDHYTNRSIYNLTHEFHRMTFDQYDYTLKFMLICETIGTFFIKKTFICCLYDLKTDRRLGKYIIGIGIKNTQHYVFTR